MKNTLILSMTNGILNKKFQEKNIKQVDSIYGRFDDTLLFAEM
jgi:hypothetical protein